MKTRQIILILISLIIITTHISARIHPGRELLPFDETVTHGQLENGLTYYIKHNAEPKDIAYLYLVVKVGSVDEDDNQRGLAHFLEHCAFNGSEHFPGNGIREYLNSVGSGMLSGGANASTGFEVTNYFLQTKTTDPEQLDKMFLILSDYASGLSLDHDAIDKERGIILEERRSRSGARSRMMDKIYEVLYYNSQYSRRMPIGTVEVIEGFEYQTLKDFYNDWYRPDLQAVIAVGDFDVQAVQGLIEKHFAGIPAKVNPREKVTFEVPEHTDTKVVYATDNEATDIQWAIYYKSPFKPVQTIDDYRIQTIISLTNLLLNKRFADIARSPNPPFTSAYAFHYQVVNPTEVYALYTEVDEEHTLSGFTALVTEIQRVKQYGFHASELEIAKANLLSQYEKSLSEKDKTNSRRLIWPLSNHFTSGTQPMNIEREFTLVSDMLEYITLDDIDMLIEEYITEENRVVALLGPDTINQSLLEMSDLLRIFDEVVASKLEPYAAIEITEPLIAKTPKPVKAGKPKHDSVLDVWTWELKNGAKVYLKTTDFKNNEINLTAFRTGGLSHAEDSVYQSAKFAHRIQNASGIGPFDANQMTTYLAGKDVSLNSFIRNEMEGVDGRSSIKDLEMMLQMMWLTATQPRYDEAAFTTWQNRQITDLRNRLNNPYDVFLKTWNNIAYDNHLRGVENTLEDVQNVSHRVAFDYFKSRFESANGFHFVFVGNITQAELQPLIETYLASLPNKKAKTNVVDRGLRLNQRLVRENIYKGQEETRVVMQFTTSRQTNWQFLQKMEVMTNLLNEMLFDNVREKMSGVYDIFSHYWKIEAPANQVTNRIAFGADPVRVDEIIAEVNRQIGLLKAGEFDETYFETAKGSRKKEIELQLRNNSFWAYGILREKTLYGYSSGEVISGLQFLQGITRADVVEVANICFDPQKYITIVLYPQEREE